MPGQSQLHVHFGPAATQYAKDNIQKQSQSTTEEMALLKFPHVKNVLWDHTSAGETICVGLSYYRKPKLCISDKVLRLAQRHLESTKDSACSSALLGTLSVDDDGEGVTFTLDRFDPGGTGPLSTAGLTPGDISVPFQMNGSSKSDRKCTVDDYMNALLLLQQKCCSKDSIELSNFLLTRGWCNFYSSGENSVHHLEFDVITMATEFNVTPIATVPIVPTALSKNLSGPMSLSHLQGEPKTGYLTMDHTRKVLLVLESDPKVFNLPLVGIWVSGVPYVYSTFVWSCCLRYLHNSRIHDRVCVPPEPFLMVLYNPLHSKPEFYEVTTSSGNNKMDFDLYSGYEAVSLPKMATCNTQGVVEIDLSVVKQGVKKETLDGALHEFYTNSSRVKKESLPVSPTATTSASDEITPRSKPAPHKSQMPKVMPMVPEVSLIFGDDGQSGIFTDAGPRKSAINHGRPNGVHHVKDYSSRSYETVQNSVPSVSSHSHTLASGQVPRPVQQPGIPVQSRAFPGPHQPNGISHQYINNGYGPQIRSTQHTNLPQHMNGNMEAPVPHGHQHGIRSSHPSAPMHHPRYSQPQPQPNYSHRHFVPISQPFGGARMVNSNHHNHVPVPTSLPAQQQQPRGGNCNCPDCLYNLQNNMGHPSGMAPASNVYRPQPQHRPLGGTFPMQHPHSAQYNAAVRSSLPDMRPIFNGAVPHDYMHNEPPSSAPQQVPVVHSMPVQNQLSEKVSNTADVPVSKSNAASGVKPEPNHVSNSQNDSSGRSSDDSGFSVTPEKPKTATDDQSQQVPQSAVNPSDVPLDVTKVNWSQVPPEVHQLLLQQATQLKQLQAQIQVLMNNQSLSTQCTTMTNLDSTSASSTKAPDNAKNIVQDKPQMCTVGINTSLFCPPPQEKHSVSLQTSPRKSYPMTNDNTLERSDSSNDRPSSQGLSDERSSHSHGSNYSISSQNSGRNDEHRTPAEFRHRGVLPMNSTEREDFDMDMSQGDLACVANNVALHNKTLDSIQSEMIVDMPSYHSSPSRSQASPDTGSGSRDFSTSSQSPISASMCEQQQDNSDSEEEEEAGHGGDGQISTDNKEYYDKLMENIHHMLHQQEDSGAVADSTEFTKSQTLQHSIMLGQYLNSLRFDGTGQNAVETTFIPKINYMSMMFDSDSDCSMEINAMAMKYLKDEQLTQLNKLQTQSRLKGAKENHNLAMLRHVLMDDKDATPNVTNVGMSPNDMTFATRKYMEKHGLLNDTGSTRTGSGSETSDDSYQLKINFSNETLGIESPSRDVMRTPINHKSRSPFLDSLRNADSKNSRTQAKTPQLNGSVSPAVGKAGVNINTCGSPLVNSHNTLGNSTGSPYIKSYNTTGEMRQANNFQFTPSHDTTPQHAYLNSKASDSGNYTPSRVHDQTTTPQRNGDDLRRKSNRKVRRERGNSLSPRQQDTYDPEMSPRNAQPRPEQVPRSDKRVLSPVTKDVIQERAEHRNENPKHEQRSPRHDNWREEKDNILDITRLKMLPKLL